MRKFLLVGGGLTVLVVLSGVLWAYVRSTAAGKVSAESLKSYEKTEMVQFENPKIYHLNERSIAGFFISKVREEEYISGTVYGELAYVRVPAHMAEKFVKALARQELKLHGPVEHSEHVLRSYVSPQTYERMKQVSENPMVLFSKNFGFYALYVMPVLLALAWLGTALGFRLARKKR